MADPTSCPPLSRDSISEAYAKIAKYIHYTPLKTCSTLDHVASSENPASFGMSKPQTAQDQPQHSTAATNGAESCTPSHQGAPALRFFFKCENQQKIGAFKARGAYHALLHLIDELGIDAVRSRGVTTHSSGNHAQALALAAATFNVPAYIVMPTISTPSKIAGVRKYTSHVQMSGSTSTEREEVTAKWQKETGAILVPPYDHADIILGQGTVGLEMEEQFRELQKDSEEPDHALDAVLVPTGGGGLCGGVATWFASHSGPRPKTYVFGAEPSFQGANDGEMGLKQGKRIEHVSSLTIADGVRTPIGLLNWTVISDPNKVEGIYSVTEDQIRVAMRLVMERMKEFIEPTAAVGLAVALFNQEFRRWVSMKQASEGTGRPWNIGVVLSGGNTTMEAIMKIFGEHESGQHTGRETGQVGVNGDRKVEDVAG